MRREINGLTITSNVKQCLTKRLEDFSKKKQAEILEEYSYIEEIELSYFVVCRGMVTPTEIICNFEVNTVPQKIRNYFYKRFPQYYCGVSENSIYLNGSDIVLISEFEEHYIVFHIN